MANWDEDSPQLRKNLAGVLASARDDAAKRAKPTLEMAKAWHRNTLRNLTVPDPRYVGEFTGEKGLESAGVRVGPHPGVEPGNVAGALGAFEKTLQAAIQALDGLVAPGQDLDKDQLVAVIELCAWVHAEWVRIHSFANRNGRTARLWANFVAMRYGLPPFVRLRPRPDGLYGLAAEYAMQGDWHLTAFVLKQMYAAEIKRANKK
jgi:Fic/DOC family